MSELLDVLRLFWDKDVARVSPGALGMVVRGKPYEKREIEAVVAQTEGVCWDGEWMVRD